MPITRPAYIDTENNVLNGNNVPVRLPPAYSSLWYHDGESTTTIVTQNIFAQVVDFENVGAQDANGNVVGDAITDNDLVIGADGAGTYSISIGASFRSAVALARDIMMAPGILLNAPIGIKSSTDATPIEIETTDDHGLKTGDVVRISGHAVNVAANTDAIVTVTASNTFTLADLSNADIAGSGAGAGAGGNIDIVFPGNIVSVAKASQTQLERGYVEGLYSLAAGDSIRYFIANLDSADDYVAVANQMNIRRID